MVYAEPTEDNPLGLIEGVIFEGENGPRFRTSTSLSLDAPNLALPGGALLAHNLYSVNIPISLEGPITFFDDGRMQIEQRNLNAADITVRVDVALPVVGDLLTCLSNIPDLLSCLAGDDSTRNSTVEIPLQIPSGGVYLNFISNPIKEIPEEY